MKPRFYGLQQTTLLDYPGLVAAIIFFPGCNFRCPYCHNPELIYPASGEGLLTGREIQDFLKKRAPVLGGTVLSGGEPLLYSTDSLSRMIGFIRDLGLKVKIDTNGSFPEKIKELSFDYIAMDIKTLPTHYSRINPQGPSEDLTAKIIDSIKTIIRSGVPHEFRTTVVPGIVGIEDIKNIAPLVKGADKYYLHQFRPRHTLDPAFTEVQPYDSEVLEEMREILTEAGVDCEIR